jgi:hypothetical protein
LIVTVYITQKHYAPRTYLNASLECGIICVHKSAAKLLVRAEQMTVTSCMLDGQKLDW